MLSSGEHFGEVGVIKELKRAATVRTTKDSHFAVLKKEDFKKILSAAQERVDKKTEFFGLLTSFH